MNKSIELSSGTAMERGFIVVEGSDQSPVVLLHDRFHSTLAAPGEQHPIYVFWNSTLPTRPDWSVQRVVDPDTLNKMALILEEQLATKPGRGLSQIHALTPL